MPTDLPHPPSRPRRFDRSWLMRNSAALADEARVLLAAPLRSRMLRTQAVPVRIGRRSGPRRITAL
jgi:hypothetical protein